MKTLNEKAVEVLAALLTMDEQTVCQINGVTKHVQAKEQNTIGHYRFISLIFYSGEKGWETREPEITICHDTQTGEYFPISIIYEQERILSASVNLVYGRLELINDKIQSDHANITNDFLSQVELWPRLYSHSIRCRVR